MRCKSLLGLVCVVLVVACGTRSGDEVDSDGGRDATSGMDSAVDANADGTTPLDLSFDAPGYDADLPDGTCAAVRVATSHTTPNVVVIIDQSGSMLMTFDAGRSRWDTERDALIGTTPDGIVTADQHEVRFGALMYMDDPDIFGCPDTASTPAVIDGLIALSGLYGTNSPGGNTPTGDAIDTVLTNIDAMVPMRSGGDPTIFILATDGEPGTCADGTDVMGGRALVLDRVTAAHAMGIDTYVVSVGVGIAITHLQEVANAGVGHVHTAGVPDAPYYLATDASGLTTALHDIVGGLLSCRLQLAGSIIPAMACRGTVTLGPDMLECGTDWRAVDATHIELLGDACVRAQAGAGELIATFPCDVLI